MTLSEKLLRYILKKNIEDEILFIKKCFNIFSSRQYYIEMNLNYIVDGLKLVYNTNNGLFEYPNKKHNIKKLMCYTGKYWWVFVDMNFNREVIRYSNVDILCIFRKIVKKHSIEFSIKNLKKMYNQECNDVLSLKQIALLELLYPILLKKYHKSIHSLYKCMDKITDGYFKDYCEKQISKVNKVKILDIRRREKEYKKKREKEIKFEKDMIYVKKEMNHKKHYSKKGEKVRLLILEFIGDKNHSNIIHFFKERLPNFNIKKIVNYCNDKTYQILMDYFL